jgi:hypothetical protein
MIIANRLLNLRRGQTKIDVPVRIYAPEAKETDWSCQYEIGWPGEPRQGYAAGIDSVQALLHALQKVGAEIYSSDYHKSGNLVWDKPTSGYGFPVPQTLRELLLGDDAKFL